MAGYYDRDAVDDFDDFDSEPYKGGYDQVVAYGKPIPPSEDTCYPPSIPSEEEDESHGFLYGSESCPYGDCIDEDRPMHGTGSETSYGRPKPQPPDDFDEPQPYASDEYGQRPPPPSWSRPPYQENESGYSEGWKKSSYGEEAEEPVPKPPRFERPNSYEGEEEPYRKPYRPSYTQEEEEASPRFETPNYRQDEEYERPEYGGEEDE